MVLSFTLAALDIAVSGRVWLILDVFSIFLSCSGLSCKYKHQPELRSLLHISILLPIMPPTGAVTYAGNG